MKRIYERISQSEAGRRLGCSPQQIHKLVDYTPPWLTVVEERGVKWIVTDRLFEIEFLRRVLVMERKAILASKPLNLQQLVYDVLPLPSASSLPPDDITSDIKSITIPIAVTNDGTGLKIHKKIIVHTLRKKG